jgi:hypothetical protein
MFTGPPVAVRLLEKGEHWQLALPPGKYDLAVRGGCASVAFKVKVNAGRFTLTDVETGTYDLRVEAKGVAPQIKPNVEIGLLPVVFRLARPN